MAKWHCQHFHSSNFGTEFRGTFATSAIRKRREKHHSLSWERSLFQCATFYLELMLRTKSSREINDPCWFLQEAGEQVNDFLSLLSVHTPHGHVSVRPATSGSFIFLLASPSSTSLIIAPRWKNNSDAPWGLIERLLNLHRARCP